MAKKKDIDDHSKDFQSLWSLKDGSYVPCPLIITGFTRKYSAVCLCETKDCLNNRNICGGKKKSLPPGEQYITIKKVIKQDLVKTAIA